MNGKSIQRVNSIVSLTLLLSTFMIGNVFRWGKPDEEDLKTDFANPKTLKNVKLFKIHQSVVKNLELSMETEEIIKEIKKLTIKDRLKIIEKTAKTIQEEDEKEQMRKAADQLYGDYKDDVDLTAFTALDLEEFYETR